MARLASIIAALQDTANLPSPSRPPTDIHHDRLRIVRDDGCLRYFDLCSKMTETR